MWFSWWRDLGRTGRQGITWGFIPDKVHLVRYSGLLKDPSEIGFGLTLYDYFSVDSGLRLESRIGLVLLALIAALLAMSVFWQRNNAWEYRIVSPADADLHYTLEQMGVQGYELVSARRANGGDENTSDVRYEMIFKRRLGYWESLAASEKQAAIKRDFDEELQRRLNQKPAR